MNTTGEQVEPEGWTLTTVLTLFGTRPEIITLAPVIHRLERRQRDHSRVGSAH